MKRLNLAIIGQGRSGRDIHGVYCRSERNAYYNVKYIVDFDERRRNQAKDLYPGCVVLAVFQNTQLAPFYLHALKLASDGTLGEVEQVSIRYNSLSRRWDWQTLQKYMGGSAYNTGPHPIAMGLGFLGFDKNSKVVYSKLDTCRTSGDAEDYVKILLAAPNKPLVDIEMNSIDAFSDYNIKIQGSKGTLKSNPKHYQLKYVVDGENPEQPVQEHFVEDENGNPISNRSNESPRPNIDFENPNYISSLYKEDASFLRIGQVTLGYTLPKALLQNVGIQKLRVYATVQNAYVFTGYSGTDPESGGDFNEPMPRTYLFGVNLSF